MKKDIVYVRASSSLPLVSHRVEIDGKFYLDGGVADSIPIKQAQKMGNDKNVVVLTREKEYRKEPAHHSYLMKIRYAKYPLFRRTMKNRHISYNSTLEYINDNEEKGNIFVIRPPHSLNLGRLEKDKDKLRKAYELGYKTARENYEKMMEYLNK